MIALRIRVRKSAIGSVIFYLLPLPARLDDARNLATQRQVAEADAAHLKLAKIAAGAAAHLATVTRAHLPLLLLLDHVDELRHLFSSEAASAGPVAALLRSLITREL